MLDMCYLTEKPPGVLLSLAIGTLLCGIGLVGLQPVLAQPSPGASPATTPSIPASARSPAVTERIPYASAKRYGQRGPVAAPRPRLGHAELRRRYEIDPAHQDRTSGLSTSDRWDALRDEVVAPGFLVGSLAIGFSDHLTDDPSRWQGNTAGYALRAGSTAGRLLLEAGATHGLAAAMDLDPRFVPHRTGGVGSQLRHAVLSAVTARTSSGAPVPNVPRLAGTYGAALVEQQWTYRETRFRTAAYTLALSVGIDVAVHVVTEFATSR